ncbi:MAG: hypothetical protein A3E88_00630 [Legionellales bacterium RIFCSPHIGHO2_12_FULL_35_11]|nr:MAG: hypothetical protein A3E88_00630 [Legionellales bacterium RIFCSPHIGHO2_12_FULL_35_11]
MHNVVRLIEIFHSCFEITHNTILKPGDDEPIYIPENLSEKQNIIYFAHGFFSSALHECAHWFIAGSERRKLLDYGYWYEPDGRSAEQQALFYKVEVKPQAIELIFSEAVGLKFNFSLDNLSGQIGDTEKFKDNVYKQVQNYREFGLPKRAGVFLKAIEAVDFKLRDVFTK